jgi:hypothetical protein
VAKQTTAQAVEIAANCARALRIAGHQADVPYSQAQLCEVIATLMAYTDELKEQTVLANRRYSATNAQLARYKKNAKDEPEPEAS